MKYKNIISIIIPVYNAENYIGKCIQTIQRQSFPHWRLVLVDDGSSDKSREICRRFSLQDKRIILICQNHEGGAIARKNGALCTIASQSKYILFVDNDDELPCDALEMLIQAAEKYDADIICGNYKKMVRGIIIPFQKPSPCLDISEPVVYNKQRIMDELFISYYGVSCMPVALWAKLCKTELVQSIIDMQYPVGGVAGDMVVTIKLVEKANSIVMIPNCVYKYRMGGSSSKFSKELMNGYVVQYNYKKNIGIENSIPKQWYLYLNIELLNVFKSNVRQYIEKYGHDSYEAKLEVKKSCLIPEIKEAANAVRDSQSPYSEFASLICNSEVDTIINQQVKALQGNRIKRFIKKVLLK